MNRKFTFLGLFVLISILMWYPMYHHVLEGDTESFVILAGTYLSSSVLIYFVYIGKIKTGASVVLREKYEAPLGHSRARAIRFIQRAGVADFRNELIELKYTHLELLHCVVR